MSIVPVPTMVRPWVISSSIKLLYIVSAAINPPLDPDSFSSIVTSILGFVLYSFKVTKSIPSFFSFFSSIILSYFFYFLLLFFTLIFNLSPT